MGVASVYSMGSIQAYVYARLVSTGVNTPEYYIYEYILHSIFHCFKQTFPVVILVGRIFIFFGTNLQKCFYL